MMPISPRAAFCEEEVFPSSRYMTIMSSSGSGRGPPDKSLSVFLSHSTKDRQFVEMLAAELDIEFGPNFVAKIEKGMRDANLTVLFLVV
jgi:hypothetical protein